MRVLFFSITLFVHGLLFAQKDEVNFSVSSTAMKGHDVDLEDSTFFSMREAIKHPLRVRVLSLESQGLQAFPMDIFKFKNLKTLNISYNNITVIPPDLFNHCYQLEELMYAGNGLRLIPDHVLHSRLKVLDLSQNSISSIPEKMSICTGLQELDLRVNEIVSWPSKALVFKKMKTLALSGNPLPELSNWLVLQPQLEVLLIDNTGISELGDNLCENKKIKFLNIEDNEIKVLPSCMCNMSRLKVIFISGNKLEESELTRLKKCLPHLQIR